jgi:hypothetical protein
MKLRGRGLAVNRLAVEGQSVWMRWMGISAVECSGAVSGAESSSDSQEQTGPWLFLQVQEAEKKGRLRG